MAGLLTLGLAGCETGTDLEPAEEVIEDDVATPETKMDPLSDEQAISQVEGISVEVDAGAWPGDKEVKEELSPLRVTIVNQGDRPLRIRYDAFDLDDLDGRSYNALPPFEIDATLTEPVVIDAYDPIMEPEFEHEAFEISPVYDPVYDIDVYDDSAEIWYDESPYYSVYGPYWAEIEMPTTNMLLRALPEGVLSPGGRLSGYLYFERVPEAKEMVWFRADLIDAVTGEEFGLISIPFKVE